MRLITLLCATALLGSCTGNMPPERTINELRAPSYPLVTIDPYTSAWSAADHLYDNPVKHWTGKNFPLLGIAKVDGKAYRFMGEEELELYPLSGTSLQTAWEGKYTFTDRKSVV